MRFKFLIGVFLVLTVATVAIFGFAMMIEHGSFQHDGCLAALSGATPCPESANPTDYAAFHLDLLKTFTYTVEQSSMAIVLIVLSVLLSWLLFKLWRRSGVTISSSFYRSKKYFLRLITSFQLRLRSWLAMLEARDPYPLSLGALVLFSLSS